MDLATQNAVLYITAALCTFLAILLTYRWFNRRPDEAAKRKDEKMATTRREEDETVEEDEQEDEEDSVQVPKCCPFGFGTPPATEESEQESPDDDLFIKSFDIKPLSEEEMKSLDDDNDNDDVDDEGTALDEKLDWKKVKDLEEEVQKSMSDEQLEEERRIRKDQLAAIFSLMKENEDRFGMKSVDEVQNQYKLYV